MRRHSGFFLSISGIVMGLVGIWHSIFGGGERAWQALAADMGLSYEPKPEGRGLGRMLGSYRGRELTIDSVVEQATNWDGSPAPATCTRIELSLNNPQDVILMMTTKLGLMDMELVTEGPETLITRIFDSAPPNLREMLHQELKGSRTKWVIPHLKVNGQSLYFTTPSIIKDKAYLRKLVDLLWDFAQALEQLDNDA